MCAPFPGLRSQANVLIYVKTARTLAPGHLCFHIYKYIYIYMYVHIYTS